MKEIKEVWDSLTHEQRLAATAYVFQKICEHARSGGTYRHLIYNRLGFGPGAYLALLPEGMHISNRFSLRTKNKAMKEFKDKEKNEYLEWIVNYIVEENFPKEHLIAIRHIVGLFNDCKESEREIFDFSKKLCAKYK